jgi:hypothetical protein
MINKYINWTKVYALGHQNGFFKMYVSSHTDGFFFGAVLYYVKTGDWTEGNMINLDMKLEQFIGRSEESVYEQCITWVDQNLPGKFP